MKIQITRLKPEPSLKLQWYKFLAPYANLVDALVGIITFSQFATNFHYQMAMKLAMIRSKLEEGG